jgi:hypothetical protein
VDVAMKRLVDQNFADQSFASLQRRTSLERLTSLQSFASLASLMAEIGRSPILVAQSPAPLPEGFEEVDRAILAWIAGETHRMRRHATLM